MRATGLGLLLLGVAVTAWYLIAQPPMAAG
jgi:hypothetical protein